MNKLRCEPLRLLPLTLAFLLPLTHAIPGTAESPGQPDHYSPSHFRDIAGNAVDDLIRHFWTPADDGGEILPSWQGLPSAQLPDPRGAIWERAMMLFALDNYVQATEDARASRIIGQECRRFMRRYRPGELEAAGTLLHTAVDDCGWNAALYLLFYRHTGETWMLDRAVGLLNNTYDKWMDDALGGGLWYRDEKEDAKHVKSLYAAAIVLDSLDVWKHTGRPEFHDRALRVYEWMHNTLARPDGIYYCDCNTGGPLGRSNPDNIHEAGSVSFLAGNMAMAVIHARMFRDTGEDRYRQRAVRTAQGILDREVVNGLYLNDRDAWVNAVFMGPFVREVLPLPGVNPEHRNVLFRTADSIMKNDRTPDGYYGGCWGGPADGPGSKWSAAGSTPAQIMTSANAVNVVIAAAALEKLK